MTYFRDVYKKRGNWWGNTSNEQYLNAATKYFEDYLLNSPNAGVVLLNDIEVRAAIHDNKQDENEISKFFLISLDTEISQGDLIYWLGSYWLVIRKEQRNFEAYNKVLAFRCNYDLNWIDEYGVFNTTPCYLFGGMESKMQDNFKAASGLTFFPQGNKNIEVILPYKQIKSDQRFIIRNEAWRVLERDLVSVDGILYMYLAEDLVDSSDDNTTLSIADYGNLNSGHIDIGLSSLTLGIGQSFTFHPILYKDKNVILNAQFVYSSREEDYYLTINSNTITGIANGSAILYVSSVDQMDLQVSCAITVAAQGVLKDVVQLIGDDNIRWGRTRTYTAFYNSGGAPSEIAATFTLINNTNNLVTFVTQETTSCSIIANTIGLAGTVTLRATTAKGTVDKLISVVSVW